MPERDPGSYSGERLLRSLEFASTVLARRDISPRTEKYYRMFKEVLIDALEAKTPEEKLTRVRGVEVFERVINDKAFLQPRTFSENMEMEDALLQLRELQYLARYRDYVKVITGQVRLHAGKTRFAGWETLSGKHQWIEISQRLKKEEYDLAQAMKEPWGTETKYSYSTMRAIDTACEGMGYDPKMVKWSIHTYAKSNATFHKDLDHLVSNGLFHDLAAVLYHDLRDIYCVFSETRSQTDLDYLERVIKAQIDRWFNTSVNPDNPQTWYPTPELVATYDKAKEKKAKAKRQPAQNVSEQEAKDKDFAFESAARIVHLEEAFARWTLKDWWAPLWGSISSPDSISRYICACRSRGNQQVVPF